MKHSLMEIIVCPTCKGDLTLTVESEKDGEIMSGTLRCANCNVDYCIEEGIPDLMPPNNG